MGKYAKREEVKQVKRGRGRPLLFRPGVWTRGDERFLGQLRADWTPTDRPIILQWKTFLEMNSFTNNDASYLQFVSQMLRSRLKRSTIATYAEEIQDFRLRPEKGMTPRSVMKQLQLLVAAERRTHAPDRSTATLAHSIISRKIDLLNCGIGLALLCGLRVNDISNLQGRQIKLEGESLKIDVRISKNRRSQHQMTTLTILKDSPLWHEELVRYMEEYLRHLPKKEAPWKDMHSAEYSKRLSELVGKKCTSYTLRRNYIRRVIASFTFADGRVDWSSVTQMTLHLDEATVKAYYAKHAESDDSE